MAETSKKGRPRAPKKLRPINVRVDDEMLEEMRAHAALEDRPVSNLIYRVMRTWLDQNRHLIEEG